MPVVDGQRGRAFDVRDRSIGADDVAAAVAREGSAIQLRCPEPGPIHDRVGIVEPGRSYPLRAALAAAARQRGRAVPQDDELAAIRDRLAELELPEVSLGAVRRRVAETEDTTGLEEQVVALRGQLEAARERGDDSEALAEARERAVADLAERRTERLAAEQSLERARISARAARDRREERLQLQDRERNLERAARRMLAASMEPAFERALSALPGSAATTVGESPGSVDGPDALGALAICRIARLRAPVIVAGDWYDSATAAAAALDAPVILVDP